MDWQAAYRQSLDERDAVTEPLAAYFEGFMIAAKRAAVIDRVAKPADMASSQLVEPEPPSAVLDAKEDLIKALKARLSETENKLSVTVRQLEQAQQRARDMVEEQYMKTHAVQDLHDEIVALTMQINLSEQKREGLERENADLIARWVARVGDEAHQLNLENARSV